MRQTLSLSASVVLLLAACSGAGGDGSPDSTATTSPLPGSDSGNPAAGTRPSGQPNLVTVEGRIESGVECPVLHTPDGDIWALSLGEADFGPGDYVSITGEIMDASICMQGKGTLLPQSIDAKDPPARDRDPAQSGGVAVTSAYVQGDWVAKGVNADCAKPDFAVTQNSNGGSIIETRINGTPETGYVDVGDTPALQWDAPLAAMPIETRGPDGLAVMPGEGPTVTLAGHRIEGDGVVFVKCA
jgi:hypothetical protein